MAASPKQKITLSFDSHTDWEERVKKIIDVVFPSKVQKLIRKLRPDKLYSDTCDYVLDAFEKVDDYQYIHQINERLVNAFDEQFSHWRGFHSCRPISLDGYKQKGIVPLTREFLVKEALRAFKGLASEEDIKRVIAEDDLKTREGYIYFFCESTAPLDRSSNHYLHSGSEILACMAVQLKLGCQKILAAQGKPYILQCKIESSKVRPAYKECIYRELVTVQFQREMSKGKICANFRHSAFATKDGVPPQNIEKFIPVEQTDLAYGFHTPH